MTNCSFTGPQCTEKGVTPQSRSQCGQVLPPACARILPRVGLRLTVAAGASSETSKSRHQIRQVDTAPLGLEREAGAVEPEEERLYWDFESVAEPGSSAYGDDYWIFLSEADAIMYSRSEWACAVKGTERIFPTTVACAVPKASQEQCSWVRLVAYIDGEWVTLREWPCRVTP